jgi:UDP-N-acetylmuramoyl-L-alanyl-D-glutamate--2,6-diaminopimelate ligase
MAKLADRVIITTDNPRSERPEDIARDVEVGVVSSGSDAAYEIILDRKEAIRSALDRAEPGDVVLIAGKGPENYIDFGDHKVPFSDAEVVREWIEERGGGEERDERN